MGFSGSTGVKSPWCQFCHLIGDGRLDFERRAVMRTPREVGGRRFSREAL
jgi:hypothetical protein